MQYILQTARFSRCRKFRYVLSRSWDKSTATITFIGLNPSTADADHDDPTIRRCVNFACNWGYGSINMVNLFAYRSTSPANLKIASEPIGKRNDYWIGFSVKHSSCVVACWGNWGTYLQRDKVIRKKYSNLLCMGQTAQNQPAHPLYLPADTRLINLRSQ